MSPSVQRWRTERALRQALAKHGDDHPATHAAYARAIVVWGASNLPPVPVLDRHSHVYAVSSLRAQGAAALYNRHDRQRANSFEQLPRPHLPHARRRTWLRERRPGALHADRDRYRGRWWRERRDARARQRLGRHHRPAIDGVLPGRHARGRLVLPPEPRVLRNRYLENTLRIRLQTNSACTRLSAWKRTRRTPRRSASPRRSAATDPAHECTSFVLRGSKLEVLVDAETACAELCDAANSADEDKAGRGNTLMTLCRTIRAAVAP